jgi:hypothetical protein
MDREISLRPAFSAIPKRSEGSLLAEQSFQKTTGFGRFYPVIKRRFQGDSNPVALESVAVGRDPSLRFGI